MSHKSSDEELMTDSFEENVVLADLLGGNTKVTGRYACAIFCYIFAISSSFSKHKIMFVHLLKIKF